jgi:uroporphyrinogen decarboxylase
MNITEWKIRSMLGNERLALPIMTNIGIRLIGASIREAAMNGRIHFAAVKALNDKYPLSAATLMMDLSVEAEAFGSELLFKDFEIPAVVKPVIGDLETIESLEIPMLDAGRLPQYLLASRLSAESISYKPVLACCTGPFTLAGLLLGLKEIMTAILIRPDLIRELLEKSMTFLTRYCKALKHTGIDGIIIAEPSAGYLSAEEFKIFSVAFINPIVEALQDENFIVIFHCCADCNHLINFVTETNAGGYHFGELVDIENTLKLIPAEKLVFGNIDPVRQFEQGSTQEMLEAVQMLHNSARGHSNFQISSGCDIPYDVPIENIDAFFGGIELFNSRETT